MALDDGTATASADSATADEVSSRQAPRTREDLIAETLDWCAEHFRSQRVRFVRPDEGGGWTVYTRQNGALLSHDGDYAEAAMARTVGLGRIPLIVGKPRVLRVGTTDLRPIAVHRYLGIPMLCQDQLAGVIECSVDAGSDVESALAPALSRLQQVGVRLLHDPALRERPALAPETLLAASGAMWSSEPLSLSGEQLAFLAAVSGPTPLSAITDAAGLDPVAALSVAESLLTHGLLYIVRRTE